MILFTIIGKGIKVVDPNGGETWVAGLTAMVHWRTNTHFAGTAVAVELWQDETFIEELATEWTPNGEGISMFTVPNVPSNQNYSVRIVSVWDETYWDTSDGMITIINDRKPKNAIPPAHWTLYQ